MEIMKMKEENEREENEVIFLLSDLVSFRMRFGLVEKGEKGDESKRWNFVT